MQLNSVAIAGVGLIGGSIGLAARCAGIGRVVGLGRSKARLDEALKRGAITEAVAFSDNLSVALEDVELIVVCMPVGLIVEQTRQLAEQAADGTLLTDGGSTKRSIVEALDGPLPGGCRFVGSHPLAGSEKTGVAHARADLFDDRVTMITPGQSTREDDVALLTDFWQGLGSIVMRMTPDEHDRAMAATSHLPHAVAVALAASLPEECAGLTGSGFGDTSRLAGGDPGMWRQIFLDNREYVGRSIQAFAEQLARLAALIDAGDETQLEKLLTQAKKKRDALGS